MAFRSRHERARASHASRSCLPTHAHSLPPTPTQPNPQATNDNDEVLAAKQANQVLECDLTADDEPAWRAVKKEVHQVL